jgi:hypothetical protein
LTSVKERVKGNLRQVKFLLPHGCLQIGW